MFERYTEKARRVIFFARYEASQFGSEAIASEHLLLGLLREDKTLANRFVHSHSAVETIRKQIEAETPLRPKISTAVDLPLAHESKRILVVAAEEAERLEHKLIATVHLLLGVLREECFAARLLQERGISLEGVRREAKAMGGEAEPAAIKPGVNYRAFTEALVEYFRAQEQHAPIRISEAPPENLPYGVLWIASLSLYEKSGDQSIPVLSVVVLRKNDRFGEIQNGVDACHKFGVPEVLLIDPAGRRAYLSTVSTGLREAKESTLKIKGFHTKIRISELFSPA